MSNDTNETKEVTTQAAETAVKGIVLKPVHLVITGIIILALFAGGIVLAINWDNWFGDKPVETVAPDIDGDASDWNGEDLPSKTDANGKPAEGIQIPGYPSINLPANQTDVQIALLNPEGNPCYFTFEIVLKESEETIYTSKQVPPGKAVTKLKLTKGLEAGEYDAVIKISTNSLTDMSPMNGANVETKLIVQ